MQLRYPERLYHQLRNRMLLCSPILEPGYIMYSVIDHAAATIDQICIRCGGHEHKDTGAQDAEKNCIIHVVLPETELLTDIAM